MARDPEGLARPVRWSLWLGAGVLCGLAWGFAIGLAKPRMQEVGVRPWDRVGFVR